MNRTVDIAPSILAANFSCLGDEIRAAERGGAAILHVDVMDGHFVPNITVGLPVVKSLASFTKLPIDAHLMISEPGIYATQFVEAGARMVSVHVETDPNLHRTLTAIRAAGAHPGVVLNPATPLSSIEEALQFVDYVLVMSVNPGFGGQAFIHNTYKKIKDLKDLIQGINEDLIIEVDGGVGLQNIATLASVGANAFVAGNAIFATDNPTETIAKMKQLTSSISI